jgi:hydrogenase maturation protein HypF
MTQTATADGRRIRIKGIVQGVGFRPWVYRTAVASGVTGRVLNDSSGVTIDAFGDRGSLDRFEAALHVGVPPAARITDFDVVPIEPECLPAFVIVQSRQSDERRRVSIPPDLATCDECVEEILDPANRRFRYPFTNCTNCGPRLTIATDVPYDRPATTMAPFEMCEDCRREYENVRDRRFHAQPIACPVCGPRLTAHGPGGERLEFDDPIAAAGRELRDGRIVAVKGIGGFHLACDATSDAAVALLRARKRRDEKPFAVMVSNLGEAERLALLSDVERRLLTSIERPIVLASKRDGSPLADGVAPRNRLVGVMLPYSPLHHLLLAEAGRPLVMTSGNLSEEPIAFTNSEALQRLRGIADLFLLHDRGIVTRCDDSVVSVVSGRGQMLRRSRGYVPRAIALRSPVRRSVLACGALLKNTFCLVRGEHAWLGPHIGDLENLETYDSYTSAIDRFERFLGVRPEIIAHDLHPDYLSTAYAKGRGEGVRVAVQHHHAHIAAVMAEHGLYGPVIGVAYDGTGLGTDGTSWGGEILVATAAGFDRAATFRPLALAGGDQAIREPWRIALALVLDAYDGDPPGHVWRLFDGVSDRELVHVGQMLRGSVSAPLAHGVGRYFDAFGALMLGRWRSTYEGQVALEWNQAADPRGVDRYSFQICPGPNVWELDLRIMVRQAVTDRLHGKPVESISAAFHNTVADATAALVRHTADAVGRLPVVLSGGCFQNARLAESIRASLVPDFEVFLPEQAPPGDGGIALGQAVVADAQQESLCA